MRVGKITLIQNSHKLLFVKKKKKRKEKKSMKTEWHSDTTF